ncbi:MAG TPA: NUDIX hydrolase [Candidatus Eisenbacteria bacterium]|nr:NUDIX hydrolase [Candidatus Eisenbacteria bacterium]
MTLPRPARFCPYCATRLVRKDDHGIRRPTCPACGFVAYQNPSPAVGVVLPGRRGLLFVRRKYEPYAGTWSLPSGFMEYGETPEQTARRETFEETGLRVRVERLIGAYPGHDDPRVRVVLLVYLVRKTGGKERAGDDAAELAWYPASRPPRDLAFRSHRQALADYRRG